MSHSQDGESGSDIYEDDYEDDDQNDEEEEEEFWVNQMTPIFQELYSITRQAIRPGSNTEERKRELDALEEALREHAIHVNTRFEMFSEISTLLNEAALKSDLSVVDILLKHGADPNILCGSHDELHTCIFSTFGVDWETCDWLAIASSLIEHGLDIDMRMPCVSGIPNIYSTALMSACQNGNLKAVEMLLEHRANVHVLDNKDRSPIVLALSAFLRGRTEYQILRIIKTLVMYGANIFEINKFGQTLLHSIAICNCRGGDWMHIVQYLVDHGVSDIIDLQGNAAGILEMEMNSHNSNVLEKCRLFRTRLQTMLHHHQRSLFAFAIGNRGDRVRLRSDQFPGAHDWRAYRE
jgi:hypothetical protein